MLPLVAVPADHQANPGILKVTSRLQEPVHALLPAEVPGIDDQEILRGDSESLPEPAAGRECGAVR